MASPATSIQVPAYTRRTRSLPNTFLPPDPRRRSTLAHIVLRKKTPIEVHLDPNDDQQQCPDFVNVYSTYDSISGHIDMNFDKDTTLDELFITFEGQSSTYVDKIASTAPTSGRTTGRHVFLRLLQPVDSDDLPTGNILKAGESYSIPFLFRVPPRLLPSICVHKVCNESIRKHHLELPPSMGDPSISGDGTQLMDDIAPAMSRVSYAVRVRATTRLANGKVMDLADAVKKVLVVPARDEEPPIVVDEGCSAYCLRKEKAVRKGLLKLAKTGRITAETTQPRSLRLPHPRKRRSADTEPATTTTTVTLRFDPASETDLPPTLGNISTRLRAYSFFGAAAYRILPEPHRADNWSNLHGVYSEGIDLSSRNLSTVGWTKHIPPSSSSQPCSRSTSTSTTATTSDRRPSVFSTASSSTSGSNNIPEPSSTADPSLPFYTTTLLVPLSLPQYSTSSNLHPSPTAGRPRIWLPSFHSCIISRSYTLELTLSYSSPGGGVGSPSISLKAPLQISSEGGTPPTDLGRGGGNRALASVLEEAEEAALLAEIEAQFGVDVGRGSGLGEESPGYEDVVPLLHAMRLQGRRGTAPELMTLGGMGGGAGEAMLPPEYAATGRVGGGGAGGGEGGIRAGEVRTYGVSVWG